MLYRPMRAHDIEEIFLKGKSSFGLMTEYSWDWSPLVVKQYLNRSFGFGFVCIDKTITGFVLIQKKYSTQKPDVAWLRYIWVDGKSRKKGIGTKLLEMASSELKKMKKKELLTDVYLDNDKSFEFFNSHKFATKEKWRILSKRL